MILFPAIDIIDGKAVRLLKGDYNEKTVYNDSPAAVAEDFVSCGSSHIHIVDLEGAKTGGTPNFESVCSIKKASGAFCEIGGGIRSMNVIEKYLDAGIDRVILGTAAVNDPAFLREALDVFRAQIAVGVDIKDGKVAIKGWTEKSDTDAFDFMQRLTDMGVSTVICTDISKDGAMKGTNRQLYADLAEKFSIDITASGGVSSMDDIIALKKLDLYAAIIGKAYYTGAVNLKEAEEAVK